MMQYAGLSGLNARKTAGVNLESPQLDAALRTDDEQNLRRKIN